MFKMIVIGIVVVIISIIATRKSNAQIESITVPNSNPSNPVVNHPLEFGYFGNLLGDTNQFYDHVTYVWVNDWIGNDDQATIDWKNQQMISQLKEAKALGISKAVLAIGDLTFTVGYKQYKGVTELVAFKKMLDDAGLTDMVIMLYPVDEPEIHGVSDAVMKQAIGDIKKAWPGPAIGVIYSNDGRMPGLSAFDWVGRDDYSQGSGVLNELPPLLPNQKWILVPGGASPWKQDPTPFFDFALNHPEVVMITAFIWQDKWDQKGDLGIYSNGEYTYYKAIGLKIKEMQFEVPPIQPIPPTVPVTPIQGRIDTDNGPPR